MEKITAACLFLSSMLLLLLLAAADPLRDQGGNNVTADASYYIQKEASIYVDDEWLSLASINGSCARYAAYQSFGRRVPVRFRPFLPGNTLETGDGFRFRVAFTSAPGCAGSGEWTVDDSSSYVVAGGASSNATTSTPEPRYFAVLRDEQSGRYTLGDCGTCPVCKNACRPIGRDQFFLKPDADYPLTVSFMKVVPRPNQRPPPPPPAPVLSSLV